MTEYVNPEKVPRGHVVVIDFTVKRNGVPEDMTSGTVTWKKPDGSTEETDTLANGGIVRAPDNATGHYQAKRTVAAGASLATGYSGTVVPVLSDGSTTTITHNYEVVASEASVTVGVAVLCTATEVKDRVSNISGLTLRSGATDARIDEIIKLASDTILAAFEAAKVEDLTDQQKNVAKQACVLLSVADLLVAMFPTAESTAKIASEYRKRAYMDIDRAISGKSAAQPTRRRLGSGVV